jgi:AcrR family transcriptional regulator
MNIKERIILAYSEMATQQGFYRISMEELSIRAGVSKRTIYRYFESKEDIIEAVIDNFLSSVGTEIDEVLSTGAEPEEILSSIMNVFYRVGRTIINPIVMRDLRTHYPHFWKKIDVYRMSRVHHVIQAILQENRAATIRDYDSCIITALVISSIQTILNPEFILSNNLSFEGTVLQLIEFFKHGLLKEQ